MSYFKPASPPKTNLGRYRLLAPTAGVHVSPLQLGGASIGDKWHSQGFGNMNKDTSFKLLDAFYEAGGNFIDTANDYQDETSELYIGEWMEKRSIRDQLFIASKYSSNYKKHDQENLEQTIMYIGNNVKSMHVSIEASLKKLRTTYIDLYYVHWWDWDTSINEVMRALHTLILQGKVLYLGISNTPAWIVSKANQYANDHGLTPFSVYQGAWNILDRSLEREIIPMARHEGMAIAPFFVLAAGKIRTDEEEENRRQTGENGRTVLGPSWERNEKEKLVCQALEKVAKEVGAKYITSVAIAYVMQKTTYVFPIIGGRKVEHLMQNIEALDISLSDQQIRYLESIVEFDPGFPGRWIGDGTQTTVLMNATATIEPRPIAQPIRPTPTKEKV